ncbi:kappa-casein [Carlito syrichta]|uniref:Kappa-casein n=1 Tax=Carlito syrichta TaxID=1868482 RepID=A0A1U7UQF7_CARSF|nr:kappa-casein [Carlito syrichta]
MKSFLLAVNVLALTLPFLAAEVQNQEQPACYGNDERLFNQKPTPNFPIHYVLNSYPHYAPYFYQPRPAASIHDPYMPYQYYVKPAIFRPHSSVHPQIPQWQVLSNIHPPTAMHPPYQHPAFIAFPPKKTPVQTALPTINTIATVEPTPISATEPVVNNEVPPKASSEFIITSTPEATTVPVSSTVA